MTTNKQSALDGLRAYIRAFLTDFKLSHTCDVQTGERFPLLDRLCAPGDAGHDTGEAEIALLAEALVTALPEGAADAVKHGGLHAVMEAAAWRNAMNGLCTIWPATADEAADHLRRRLHPQHYAEPATSPGTTAERAPVATEDGIDYTVVQAFADKHGVSYNAACAMVRAACAGVQPSTGAGVGLHPDTMLLNWLEQHGTVNFDFETAQVRFPIPESFRAADSLREIFDAARAHQEHADQLEGAA